MREFLEFDKRNEDKVAEFLRSYRPKLWKGKPALTKRNFDLYNPPTTNAVLVNAATGAQTAITSPTALILFSSDADVAAMLPLLQAMDPNTAAFDGSGVVCPPVVYGSDGRKINCFKGIINGGFYETAVGILLAQKHWGAMWNFMHLEPYNKLVADMLNPSDVQVDWET